MTCSSVRTMSHTLAERRHAHDTWLIWLSNGRVDSEAVMKVNMLEAKDRLLGWGRLKKLVASVDAAFTPEVDEKVARTLKGRS